MSRTTRLSPPDVSGAVDLLEVAVDLQRDLPASAPQHLATLESWLGGRPATYVSTPITTGQRLLDWLSRGGDSFSRDKAAESQIKAEVMRENRVALEPLVARLREGGHRAIIDPTDLSDPDWKQGDYHRYWVEVIGRYADDAVFANGWQYSTGCSIEFAAAKLLLLPTFDASGGVLHSAQGIAMLREGAAAVEAAGLSATVLRASAGVVEAL